MLVSLYRRLKWIYSNTASVPAKKIHILGNGIDIEEFKPALEPPADLKKPIPLFTGVMDYKPNVDAVVWLANHAWPRLRSEHPESQFIIAGMNPNTHIQRLGMLDGIEVTGYIDDILPYHLTSNTFFAPFQIAWSVKNMILQAFTCGLPVIASTMVAEGIEYQDGSDILLADDANTLNGNCFQSYNWIQFNLENNKNANP